MADREPDKGLAATYAGDGWSLVEPTCDPVVAARSEALFTLGDGFVGVRGCFEEAAAGRDVVFLNGVYETVPIPYHEKAAGFPEASDTRAAVASGMALDIDIDGTRFALDRGEVLDYRRTLDLRRGLLRRDVRWRAPTGAVVALSFERLVCLARPGLVALRITVTPEEAAVAVVLASHLDAPDRGSAANEGPYDPRVAPAFATSPWHEEQRFDDGFVHRTVKSGIAVAAIVAHDQSGQANDGPARLSRIFTGTACPEVPFRLAKFVAYGTDFGSRDPKLADETRALAASDGFAALVDEQAAYLEAYWHGAEVALAGDAAAEQALRFSMFQALQAVGRNGVTSVGAKGQTGEGYEGHYFWDGEIFVQPLLVFTDPAAARAMLVYRHLKLPQARANARLMNHACGALYPWRTIGGRECSSYFPAGPAQYHINADIAHAVRHYVEATGDHAFLVEYGAEMVIETARVWADVGFFNPNRGGAFCINEVTGPDEYSALVNNNLYTNAMAAAHLEYAVTCAAILAAERPQTLAALGVAEAETALWAKAAAAMYLPYDAARGIHPQDDAFLDREPWDIAGTPPENFPLLLHYHPMAIYRHQVCKQADAVLAMFLAGDRFAADDKRRNFDFYEPLTVHDSTLSAAAFSIVASDVGYTDKAYGYFRHSALVDLGDLHHNTAHGLHMAAMGGSWMALAYGFAGMRVAGGLSFRPTLPAPLESYRLRVRFQGRLLEIAVDQTGTRYRLLEGEALTLRHRDAELVVDGQAAAP